MIWYGMVWYGMLCYEIWVNVPSFTVEYYLFCIELGTVSIKIGPVPKFYFILSEILQPYVGFTTVLFSSISLPVFLSLMDKLCVILAKYWQRRDVHVMITSP